MPWPWRRRRRSQDRRPDDLVIGADQILECDGIWFDKPADRAAAAETLKRLRGRTHRLVSAISVLGGGRGAPWRHRGEARLTMRSFSDRFLARYLDAVGDEVTTSVGAYRLEGRGAQLFTRIEGDYFTVLGLPLLPLLAFLRGGGHLDR